MTGYGGVDEETPDYVAPDPWDGPTTPENVDDRIEAWHDTEHSVDSPHEALGWTFEEYARWVETGAFPAPRDKPIFPYPDSPTYGEAARSKARRGCPFGAHPAGEPHHYTCWAWFE